LIGISSVLLISGDMSQIIVMLDLPHTNHINRRNQRMGKGDIRLHIKLLKVKRKTSS
jgi:hypothetical protein